MEHSKFSWIAHRNHLFHSPLNPAKVNQLLSLIHLPENGLVVDFGCGVGELLLQLIEHYTAQGIGIDLSEPAIKHARAEKERRLPSDDLDFKLIDINEFSVEPASLDLAICIGSTHLFGDYPSTLRALKPMLKSTGKMIIGDGYWKKEPSEDFLQRLGGTRDEFGTYKEFFQTAIDEAIRPIYAIDSSLDDWDHYEWLYCFSVESYLATHPDDPDWEAIQQKGQHIRDRYLNGGRDALGFVVALLSL